MGKRTTPVDAAEQARRVAIGSRLREARKKKGLSVVDAARRAKVSKNHLYVLERGDEYTPSLPTIGRLAKVYGVSEAFLLHGNGRKGNGGAGK